MFMLKTYTAHSVGDDKPKFKAVDSICLDSKTEALELIEKIIGKATKGGFQKMGLVLPEIERYQDHAAEVTLLHIIPACIIYKTVHYKFVLTEF